MDLGKREIATLSRFFRNDEQWRLSVNGRLKAFLFEYDLYYNGKSFDFSPESKTKFRKTLEQDYPHFNFRQGLDKELDRVAMTQNIADEKLATIKPNDFYVLLTSQAGLIDLNDRQVPILEGMSIRVPINIIDVSALSTLVIVENQDVFDQWQKVILPEKLRHVVAVYRGHDKGLANGLKSLLKMLPENCECLMFNDLDPKGLEMCYTTPKVTGLLAPSTTDIKKHLLDYSQPALYLKQQDSVVFLNKQSTQKWLPLQSLVLANHLAIVQQTMLQQTIALRKY